MTATGPPLFHSVDLCFCTAILQCCVPPGMCNQHGTFFFFDNLAATYIYSIFSGIMHQLKMGHLFHSFGFRKLPDLQSSFEVLNKCTAIISQLIALKVFISLAVD